MTRRFVVPALAIAALGACPPLIALVRDRSAVETRRAAVAEERRIRSEDVTFYEHRVARVRLGHRTARKNAPNSARARGVNRARRCASAALRIASPTVG